MNAIIFGANGQDGFYLSSVLKAQDIDVISVSRSGEFIKGDVADYRFVENIIQSHRPDYIFHLAANSTTRHEALFDNHAAIGTGTVNILEAVYRHSPQSKVFLSGSAMQFENKGQPIDENAPFAALSAYAVSRIHSVYAGRYYRALGLRVYVGYFFNHDSPFRAEQHINQKIAWAAKTISTGKNITVEIGDITVKKEFNFAGDVMEAVWVLVNQNEVFEAVIGSGEAHSIEEWLALCFGLFGKDWREFVSVKTDFKPEYKVLVSNPGLIKSLGWQPRTSIEELAKMMTADVGF